MKGKRQKEVLGIIGGKGKMGAWFARLLRADGFTVLVSDLGTKLTNEGLVKKSDVVIFSVPIDQTIEVIKSVLDFSQPEQLWLDFTSIKQLPVEAMLKSKAEVIGSHPVFGPTVTSLRDQTMIVCPARVTKWTNWWQDLMQKNGAKVKITSPEEHDRMMAVVQGLTHFSALTISYALKQLGVDVEESFSYTSPVYKIHLDMEGRILAQDPELYADIQLKNPSMREVLEKYIQAAAKLFQIVEQKDRNAFIRYFLEAAEHLGEFKFDALRESDELIKALVKAK